ncbi:interaptin-like [Macrosteles quadrilineatus]|uniref:interaptin-like n=1 Tax=Macrosteles quadrilineatus TaxID=74068 RepID=UPI0023E2598F|nr:interaptin-like [Macrosteles quadrilineatus]
MEEQNTPNSENLPSSTSHIFKKFQKLYAKQLKEVDETPGSDGLKLKVKILENWVEDLTEQNMMLVKTVDELESEALKRLSVLEANLNQGQETTLAEGTFGRHSNLSKGLNSQIETLCRELELVKSQLSDKEKLISTYQTRIEELGSTIEEGKADNSERVFAQSHSKPESVYDQDRNVQPSVYRELENTRLQLTQVEKEVIQLKKKLKEAESNIKRLRSDLVSSEKNAKEMRAALTAEVADKHDQILALRREVNQLEEQLRQADMQTHFKDDIIKELRKEVKVARSKETLVEVLGIKERSLSHLEQLTEQLEQKNQVINCLKQQLATGSSDLLYRVRQQVDWFTENISQQCSKGNCSEEFKKCITTMVEELKESIECCNLNPSDSTEMGKDPIKFVTSLQQSLDKSKKDICQSWNSISEAVQQMNETNTTMLVDQWKVGLCKQKSFQQKLQEVVRSIIDIKNSSNTNVYCVTRSMDSLQSLLFKFTNELNTQPSGRSFTGWLKNLHCVVTELITKVQEVSQMISDVKNSDDKTHADLVCKMQIVDCLQQELNEALRSEAKAYDSLCRKEKTQRVKVDSLMALVLHHQETWKQQMTLTDDLMKEILRLSRNSRNSYSKSPVANPTARRNVNWKSLISTISCDIKQSLCNIEQRQNQVSHLELDLSSVKLVLESAQKEIDEISKTNNHQDVIRKVTVLLLKLKKQIANALIKANDLVKAYESTKQEFINSSERIHNLQKEWDVLEREVRSHWEQLSKDFSLPQKPNKGVCPSQEVLATYGQKVKELNETLDSYFLQQQNDKAPFKPLLRQYRGVEQVLKKETDSAMKKVKGNMVELKSNIKDRDKLTETQDKTICVLQNSLKRCHTEAEQLRKTIHCLELQKCETERESKRKIQELESKISKLQSCLKKYEEVNDLKENDLVEKLQFATLELASLAGNLQDDCKIAHLKITDLYEQLSDKEKRHQKAEEDFKSAIANLQESIFKEQKRVGELQDKNRQLEKQIENSKLTTESKKIKEENVQKDLIEELQDKVHELQNKLKLSEETVAKHHKSEAALQIVIANLKESISNERKKKIESEKENNKLIEKIKELEDSSKDVSKSNQETIDKITDLKKQIKCWTKQVSDLRDQLKTTQEKLCSSLKREKQLQLDLSSKDSRYKEEISKKQEEIDQLTKTVGHLTDKIDESQTELHTTKTKTCEVELKLQNVCGAYDELKLKEKEKEAQANKLQAALTELSRKFASCRLDAGTSQCVRHYQEECAKYEALYNTTACKLRSKEVEVSSLKQELERLRSELDHISMATSQQREDESCPFLMERVHQLSRELQVAHSCQNSYESMLRDIREQFSKKEEENFHLKTQMKQITLQRDTILSDLELATQEISRLKNNNSSLQSTIKRLEKSNAQFSEQLVYESDHSAHLQPNIEVQREISTALTSQLRGVKQKLHATKHDYKLLQTAYEDLNRKYTMLQRGERDLEGMKEAKPVSKTESHCRPCLAKSSKSVNYIKTPENMRSQDHFDHLPHSKSWHEDKDLERRWKRKLQDVIRGGDVMHNSSSSN